MFYVKGTKNPSWYDKFWMMGLREMDEIITNHGVKAGKDKLESWRKGEGDWFAGTGLKYVEPIPSVNCKGAIACLKHYERLESEGLI